jgi:cyanate permease
MENTRATARPALWLMFSIVLVALNLRPSMPLPFNPRHYTHPIH